MTIRSVTDMDVQGKRLIVRADLNVPLAAGKVSDSTRIDRFAVGMKPVLERGARLIILTHLGRPAGKVDSDYSVRKIQQTLAQALGCRVRFCETSVGPKAEASARSLENGEVLLCENVRFNSQEEVNGQSLAEGYARLGDIYVNDAFSCAHRAHASTTTLAGLLPATAGPMMIAEIEALTRALDTPQKPAVAVIGGAKVSTKIEVLRHLVTKMDAVIIGGGMANTFLFAHGAPMGTSLHETDQGKTVAEITRLALKSGCEILLPNDVVIADAFMANAKVEIVPAEACREDAMILDAGPKATERFVAVLQNSRTILWNGPLGAFEIPPFDCATVKLAQAAADLVQSGKSVAVAGGGDTVAALNRAGAIQDFTYVSSAGGAFLEWLEGKLLPGIAALQCDLKAT